MVFCVCEDELYTFMLNNEWWISFLILLSNLCFFWRQRKTLTGKRFKNEVYTRKFEKKAVKGKRFKICFCTLLFGTVEN